MKFEKGHKKAGGRKLGTPNKATLDIKTRIANFIDDQFDSIADDMTRLDPKERVGAYLKLMEFVIAKQREQRIDLSSLSDSQIDDLLNKALTKLT